MDEIRVSPYNYRMRNRNIIVYDTTLRDGEQMPSVAFSMEQKIKIAQALNDIGVKEIDAGFPAVGENERNFVKKISSLGLDAKILVLTRLFREDVDFALDCDADAVLLFIAASDVHLKHKLELKKDEIKNRVSDVVGYAKSHDLMTSFSTEDTTRTDLDFLTELYKLAVDAGADRIGITDTVGCINPEGMGFLVKKIKTGNIPLSVHCHNDFGLSVANAIAGVKAGADIVATTVNGIGERAGNVSLEEFAVAMKVLYNIDVNIDLTGLTKLSRIVSKFSKNRIPKNKPVVGRNAFTHESGIHVSGVLKNPATYESFPPWLVGGRRRFVLGKHSGKSVVEYKLKNAGVKVENVEKILHEVKLLGEKKGRVTDNEFWRIVKRCRKF
ncbi:MAG: homocitrate synthase family protein [Candidatus Thermoplasmatota archaeon]|nr:homocitrate synthase family protein [Candidatus Thermoplasmatota archaeon]MBU4255940.1 homocitrate synthase family protein [Candidatus Thermoplasmatota archaeon]MCG2827165.1 homocitrate synthase family protein [Thermoplasmatales archaeon]